MTLPFPPEKKRQPDTSARALLDLAKITQQIKDTPGRWMENLRGMAQHPEELVLSPLRDAAVAFFSAPEGERMGDASYLYAKAGSVPGVADPGQVITRQNTASVTPKDQWQRAVTNTGINALTALLPGGTVAKRAAVGGMLGAYYDTENPFAGALTGMTAGELFHQGLKRGAPGLSTVDVGERAPTPARPSGAPVSATGVAPVPSFLEGLYSRLGRAIDAAPFEKGTAEQWKAAVSKNAAGGERQWTGLDDYLAQNTGRTLTRQEVAQVARQGRPQIKETVSGAHRSPEDKRYAAYYEELGDGSAVGFGNTPEAARAEAERVLRDEGLSAEDIRSGLLVEETAASATDTKYSRYRVPGEATNYREVLLQHDDPRAADARARSSMLWPEVGRTGKASADAYAAFRRAAETFGRESPEARAASLAWETATKQAADARAAHDQALALVPEEYQGDHWDEPNVLGHTRMTDRTGPNGERVLFLEDTQSDWHQAGREEGYRGEKERQLAALVAEREALDLMSQDQAAARYGPEIGKARDRLQQQIDELGRGRPGVPDGPFKKTAEWTELLHKRALDEAARGGYDRLVLPTGRQAAEMFSMDKQLSSLDWITHDGGRTFSLGDPNGGTLAKNVPADKLSAYVGKEIAQKIVDGHGGRSYGDYQAGTLTGNDLKVEAAGMRAYYDQMAVNTMRDYLKTLGVGAQVEPVAMFPEGPNQSVPMTPALRQRILSGQRLWSAAGMAGGPALLQLARQQDEQRRASARPPR